MPIDGWATCLWSDRDSAVAGSGLDIAFVFVTRTEVDFAPEKDLKALAVVVGDRAAGGRRDTVAVGDLLLSPAVDFRYNFGVDLVVVS